MNKQVFHRDPAEREHQKIISRTDLANSGTDISLRDDFSRELIDARFFTIQLGVVHAPNLAGYGYDAFKLSNPIYFVNLEHTVGEMEQNRSRTDISARFHSWFSNAICVALNQDF
jgi:hypothetical protein